MESIVNLLNKYESDKNIEIDLLKSKLEKFNILNNSLVNQVENLKLELSNLHDDNKDMQSVSMIVKLTNEKIKFKNENELLKKTIKYLKKTIKDANDIKYGKSLINIDSPSELHNESPSYSPNELPSELSNELPSELSNESPIKSPIELPIESPVKSIDTTIESLVNTAIQLSIDTTINDNVETSDNIWNNLIVKEKNIQEIQIEKQAENVQQAESIDKQEKEIDDIKVIDTSIKIEDTKSEVNYDDNNIKEININEQKNNGFIDNNTHYYYKKIKGMKYLVDDDNYIYNISDTENIIGEYKLNKKNILKPIFY